MTRAELINQLSKLLTKKHQLLSQYHVLTQDQAAVIESEDIDALDNLIDERQMVIEEIDAVDNSIAGQWVCVQEELGATDFSELLEEHAVLKKVHEQINLLLQEIAELDQANRIQMTQRLKELMARRQQLGQGKKAAVGYLKRYRHVSGIFLDKKQ